MADILALCTGLRPVVMVDYGGRMPELKEHLCMLMHLCHKASFVLRSLRVMVIEDMIYLIHVKGLAEHDLSNPTMQSQPFFVDLEHDPPKMLPFTEQNMVISELVSIQKWISSVLPVDEIDKYLSLGVPTPITPSIEATSYKPNDSSCAGEHIFIQSSKSIDLSRCMKDTNVTIPTLNG
uniref:Phosphoadenosine phosphosulfate reductase n=1 Tax=Anthurium amnicola TaxID=1678845 RepID=A0A1D1YWI1_9ARAE